MGLGLNYTHTVKGHMWKIILVFIIAVFTVIGIYVIQYAQSVAVYFQAVWYGTTGYISNYNQGAGYTTYVMPVLITLPILLIIGVLINAIIERGEEGED